MAEYWYETHLHTCIASACARSTGKEHVRWYKEHGYTGIFVTDHFWGGNTAIPRDLPWEEWVDRFCGGYEDAWEEGQKVGLDVFFAWEETFRGDDYLVYGLDRAWLKEHPEVRTWSRREQYETVRRDGGCVIQAHPFRDRDYIPRILLNRAWVDGVEVANAGNDPVNDVYARNYARQLGLYETAGSDNHLSHEGSTTYGVALSRRLTSPADWVDIILRREPIRLLVPEKRFRPAPDMRHLESFWLDDREQPVPTGLDWMQ